MRRWCRLYLPILTVVIYLVFTILLFLFGPIEFRAHHGVLFGLYLSLYLIALVLGYFFALHTNLKLRKYHYPLLHFNDLKNNSLTFYYVILFVSVFANLIFYKNVMLDDNISLSSIYNSIVDGLNDPAVAYSSRMDRFALYQGNKLFNAFYFFIAFSRLLITAMIPIYWDRLSTTVKLFSLVIASFQVFIGLAAGLNKPIFDFVFFFTTSLVLFFVINYINFGVFFFRKRLLFVCVAAFAVPAFFVIFGMFMSSRGGGYSYFYNTSPLGDISVSDDSYLINTFLGENIDYIFNWLTYYLVQGYYGFSLSIGCDFDSTFGFGNSPFLLRQLEFVVGESLSHLTFQEKISDIWDSQAQWHSFYAHMANDVHFIGVVFVMFFLGFYLARVWLSALDDNIYAKLLIPLVALLFLFIPANNQVFGYLETFSYFLIVNILWLFSSFRSRYFFQLRSI